MFGIGGFNMLALAVVSIGGMVLATVLPAKWFSSWHAAFGTCVFALGVLCAAFKLIFGTL